MLHGGQARPLEEGVLALPWGWMVPAVPQDTILSSPFHGPSRARTSRVFTISFPEDLAAQAEEVARQESRNIRELFREAFRSYRLERLQRKLAVMRAGVAARPRPRYTQEDVSYTQEDVEPLVDEIRPELSPGRKRRSI